MDVLAFHAAVPPPGHDRLDQPSCIVLCSLYATLWYVDAIELPNFAAPLTKFFVGTAHFPAHFVAMFTLSFFIVMLNNQMAPAFQRQADTHGGSRHHRRRSCAT